jgi:hypothetical protein
VSPAHVSGAIRFGGEGSSWSSYSAALSRQTMVRAPVTAQVGLDPAPVDSGPGPCQIELEFSCGCCEGRERGNADTMLIRVARWNLSEIS